MQRLFIGVAIHEAVRQQMRNILPQKLPGRPVPAENWHITVKFLGATPEPKREELTTALRAITVDPFDVLLGVLGAFPKVARARILWLGLISGAQPFGQLAEEVEGVAESLGFAREGRRFHPHVTIARIEPPRSVEALVRPFRAEPVEMTVNQLTLFSSVSTKEGQVYEAIATSP
jgi:2'-5' RNA ligase